ncbi:hypothetical protein GCM10009563_20880 [Subtercola frigoramans]
MRRRPGGACWENFAVPSLFPRATKEATYTPPLPFDLALQPSILRRIRIDLAPHRGMWRGACLGAGERVGWSTAAVAVQIDRDSEMKGEVSPMIAQRDIAKRAAMTAAHTALPLGHLPAH